MSENYEDYEPLLATLARSLVSSKGKFLSLGWGERVDGDSSRLESLDDTYGTVNVPGEDLRLFASVSLRLAETIDVRNLTAP